MTDKKTLSGYAFVKNIYDEYTGWVRGTVCIKKQARCGCCRLWVEDHRIYDGSDGYNHLCPKHTTEIDNLIIERQSLYKTIHRKMGMIDKKIDKIKDYATVQWLPKELFLTHKPIPIKTHKRKRKLSV